MNDTPSDNVQNELDTRLRSMYLDLHNEAQTDIAEVDRWIRSIQYSCNTTEPTATVTFHRGQKTLCAFFRYKQESGPNRHDRYWYCERDWKD